MDVRTIIATLSTLAQLRNATRQQPAARLIATGAVCAILAAWAGIAAIGCAAVALWSYALPYVGPVWTPLIVAVAFIVVAGVLALVARMEWSRRSAPPPVPDLAEQAQRLGEQLAGALPSTAELRRLAKDNAGTLVAAALVAGVVAGSGGGKSGRR